MVDLYYSSTTAHASLTATDGTILGHGGAFRQTGNLLGNIVTAGITPDLTYIDHWISDCGKRKKDKTSLGEVSITIPFTFDEMNAANLRKFFVAATDLSKNGVADSNLLAVFESSLEEGSAQLCLTTDVGIDMTYIIPKCTIRPDGALEMSGEDWWTGPLVIDVLYYATDHWASKPYGYVIASTIGC